MSQAQPTATAVPVNNPQQPPAYSQAQSQPQQPYSQSGQPTQAVPIQGQPVTGFAWVQQAPLTEEEIFLVSLIQYGRTVKILAIIDLVFTVLNAVFLNPLILLLVIGPACGIYGAVKYSVGFSAAYAAFCAGKALYELIELILILTGVFVVDYAPLWWIVVLSLLTIGIQIWISKICIRFVSLLREMTPERMNQIAIAAQNRQAARVVFW